MVLYRISRKACLPQDPADAAGTSEGRWHLMGQRVLYFSSSLSMCVLELKANAISFERMRKDRHYCVLDVDSVGKSESIPENFYLSDWALNKRNSQKHGSDWYHRKNSLLLEVRSAVLPVEWNYVINTMHPDFASLSFSTPRSIPLHPRLA